MTARASTFFVRVAAQILSTAAEATTTLCSVVAVAVGRRRRTHLVAARVAVAAAPSRRCLRSVIVHCRAIDGDVVAVDVGRPRRRGRGAVRTTTATNCFDVRSRCRHQVALEHSAMHRRPWCCLVLRGT